MPVAELEVVRPFYAPVKKIIHLVLLSSLTVTSFAHEFTRNTSFKSTEAFVEAAKAFKPADSKSDLTKLFTILEEKNVYPPSTADSIDSCEIVWEDDTRAIAFAAAQPPTMNTFWKIGILFYLVRDSGHWHISDIHRFDAQNKAAEITCQLTSGERTEAIVTITLTRGRREWTSSVSGSYSPSGTKLIRRDPEQ